MQGRGAGSYPTGAAVLSDISALSHGYKYEFKKYGQKNSSVFTNDVLVHVYLRYNCADDLKQIEFDEITEKYLGSDYNYIVGKVNLQNLINSREYILSNHIFISLVEEKVILKNKKATPINNTKKELVNY